MQTVTHMRPSEMAGIDPDQLARLYSELGEHSAEDVICRAMEELALRLSHCERLYRADNISDLRKSSRSLIAIAEQIGMTKLSTVAADVTGCIDQQDRVGGRGD